MAERRHRSTKREVLNNKIAKNADTRKKLLDKLSKLEAEEVQLKESLKALNETKKKTMNKAQTKAKREQKKKAEQKLIKQIEAKGLSVDDVIDMLET